ncbi:hypothetical protein N7512_005945 [Penicillium capsulatum]|nr:hypothetical protein N7512_005945 [Penicillium capsulatum]
MRWLLTLSSLLSLSHLVLAGAWISHESCEKNEYSKNITTGIGKSFELATLWHKVLDKIAKNETLANHEKETHQIIKDSIGDKSNHASLRQRLKVILGSSHHDQKAKLEASTILFRCNPDWKKIESKGETTRWHDKDTGRIVTYDPTLSCSKKTDLMVMDSQQPGDKKVNVVDFCADFLKSIFKAQSSSSKTCDKWCWKKIGIDLEGKAQAPIDVAEQFATTVLLGLLFTTSKDTLGTACKIRKKREEEVKDNLRVIDWTDQVKDHHWLELSFLGWKDIVKSSDKSKRDTKTQENNPSAIARAAQAVNQLLKNDLMVNGKGELSPA